MSKTAMRNFIKAAVLACMCALAGNSSARVVINEVMYHAPNDLEDLEYIELYNSGTDPVDISGWSLAKGVKVKFAPGTKIAAKGFVVATRNPQRMREVYGFAPTITFSQKLGNHGEKLELQDGSGNVVDALHYRDQAPWPMGADGYSGSLERIDPESPGENPANWISSPLTADRLKPGGTPGKMNAGYAAKLPPTISNVKFAPDDPAPNQSVLIEADVESSGDLKEVVALYRLAGPGFEKPETAIAMRKLSDGRYSATVPSLPKDSLVRFRLRAVDASGATRYFPAQTEPRPALSYYVHDVIEPAKIPFAWMINTTPEEANKSRQTENHGSWQQNRAKPEMPWKSAFVTYDPLTRKTQLFDFVQVIPRAGGRKVHFYKDQQFDEMTGINLIYEYDDRFPLTESLAYEVYRRAGMAAEKSYHMRCWVNGRPIGFQLLVEQPNKGFLRRNKVKDDGNLYKLLWFGNGLTGQHEKKTHPHDGHADLQALVKELNSTKDREQWEVIKKNFEVEEVANYFAVNMALSYWDGFFNNYYTYHDTSGTGKWTMYPWDQDKTWGIVDGSGKVFYQLPLTFGMNGDKPPGARNAPPPGQMMMFGNAMWWRPPGWFSGPLLANPYFRRVFLARTKDIVENVYTEKNFFPLIDGLATRLRDEVRVRAEISHQDPVVAIQRFEANVNWLREHLKKRREFLLAQKELQDVGHASTN